MTSWTTERRRDERGVSAVVVSILLVVLFGFTALGVDMGALWSDKKQLQNGADAGALAVAMACAEGECGDVNATADALAADNKVGANAAEAESVVVNMDTQTVTVTTITERPHFFASVIGLDSSVVRATAVATWEQLSSGSTLPLAFSVCAFWAQTGVTELPSVDADIPTDIDYVLNIMSKSKDFDASETTDVCPDLGGGAHNELPGGFGWLETGTDCKALLTDVGWVDSDPGADGPACALTPEGLQNRTILVPIFDAYSKADKAYQITSFAGFRITGYCLPKIDGWNVDSCNGSNRRIIGQFRKWVTLEEGLATGLVFPDLGVRVVKISG